MERNRNLDILAKLDTPFFAVDRSLLRKNGEILDEIRKSTGVRILLALKAYAMFPSFELLDTYLDGICASSPHEARLGREEFGKEVHAFAAAYSDRDFKDLQECSDHIVFNSLSQYRRFYRQHMGDDTAFGLRINPQHRETEVEIYDPCAPFSRLGITRAALPDQLPEGIGGLHMHTLCQQDSHALERTVKAAEESFGSLFTQCSWVNFGGGHHITRTDYDTGHLCTILNSFRERYGCDLYLEPGEAVALNAGFLGVTVLDIIHNGMDIAVIDASAAAHTPDVLEMPYRPEIIGAGQAGEKSCTYRIGGLSCLAGDIFGDYSFDEPLHVGDRLYFTDMAIYSMVKTSTFNGLTLPDIVYYDSGSHEILHRKSFGYEDFKNRLA